MSSQLLPDRLEPIRGGGRLDLAGEPVLPCVPVDLLMTLSQGSLLLLAATLVSRGVDLVVVGGVARALSGVPHRAADLDIAVDEDSENLVRLIKALLSLGTAGSLPLTPELVVRRSPLRVVTSFGPLDIFVGRHLPRDAARKVIGGFPVRFASSAGSTAGYLSNEEEGV